MSQAPAASHYRHDPVWDAQVGDIWARVFSRHRLDTVGEVAEVGPGFTLKVGLGLRQLGFRGTLYVVEPNLGVRRWLMPRYRELLPGARVVAVPKRLREAAAVLPRGLSALVMNHVLDDLVLDGSVHKRISRIVFGQMRQGLPCRVEVRRSWDALLRSRAKLAAACTSVVGDIAHAYRSTRPKLLVVSQYPSWFHYQNGMQRVDRATASLLQQLQRRLLASTAASGGLFCYGDKEPRWLIVQSQEADGSYGEPAHLFRDHALRQEEGCRR